MIPVDNTSDDCSTNLYCSDDEGSIIGGPSNYEEHRGYSANYPPCPDSLHRNNVTGVIRATYRGGIKCRAPTQAEVNDSWLLRLFMIIADAIIVPMMAYLSVLDVISLTRTSRAFVHALKQQSYYYGYQIFGNFDFDDLGSCLTGHSYELIHQGSHQKKIKFIAVLFVHKGVFEAPHLARKEALTEAVNWLLSNFALHCESRKYIKEAEGLMRKSCDSLACELHTWYAKIDAGTLNEGVCEHFPIRKIEKELARMKHAGLWKALNDRIITNESIIHVCKEYHDINEKLALGRTCAARMSRQYLDDNRGTISSRIIDVTSPKNKEIRIYREVVSDVTCRFTSWNFETYEDMAAVFPDWPWATEVFFSGKYGTQFMLKAGQYVAALNQLTSPELVCGKGGMKRPREY